MSDKIIIGQIGLGKWGKNLLKNFAALPDCQIKYAFDLDPANQEKLSADFGSISFIANYSDILDDKEIQAVVVSTPSPTHYELASQALLAGKHVFVEKPLALSEIEAQELISLAKKMSKKIMVGHLLMYHPAIRQLKEWIKAGELGEIYYLYSERLNLGTVRSTENVMWSTAPHDLSIILYLIGESPKSVSALGGTFLQKDKGLEDVVFLNLYFEHGEIGNVHVSWLDPSKSRKTVIVGSKKMAIFDESHNKLTLMDKGVEEGLKIRTNKDVVVDYSGCDLLRAECQHFIDCVKNQKEPLSNGQNGLDVVRVLAAGDQSLKNRGKHELL